MSNDIGIENSRFTIAQQIVDASAVSALPNTYVLGTHAKRVNFVSQQIRAMNLIWALEKTGNVKKGDHVCVIGCGLSGLTAAASLRTKGCKVTLYDKKPELLNDQRYAHHRYVHPTLNFWPEKAVNPSTNLPFFDWFAGPCPEVMNEIVAEWETHFQDKKNLPRLGLEIKGFGSQRNKVKVKCQHETGETWSEPFDVLILALGFGDEKSIEGSECVSYWKGEHIEDVRAKSASTAIVCGIGDGGLIDLFRLAFQSQFSSGRLMARFANRIAQSPAGKEIELAEREATGISDPDAASVELSTKYQKSLKNIRKEDLAFLENLLLKSMKGRLILVGPYSSPFSVRAAPVHKLILAFLISKSFFRYEQGKIESVTDKVAAFEGSGRKILCDLLVARIGSNHNITNYKDLNLQNLLQRQEILLEYNNIQFWDGDIQYMIDGSTTGASRSMLFASDRAKRAKRLSDLHTEVHRVTVGMGRDNKAILVAELHPNSQLDSQAVFPTDLFGLPLEVDHHRRMTTNLSGRTQ